MLDQVLRYTRHVSRFPCKHIRVAPQEPDERVFLFRIQVGPDKGRFARIAVDQLDLFVLFGLDVLTWGLELWDLQVIGWGLLGVEHGLSHANREVVSLCYFEVVVLVGVAAYTLPLRVRTPFSVGILSTKYL